MTKAHRSGTGSKGNHDLEKAMLFELAGLFLGDVTLETSQNLEKGSFSKL